MEGAKTRAVRLPALPAGARDVRVSEGDPPRCRSYRLAVEADAKTQAIEGEREALAVAWSPEPRAPAVRWEVVGITLAACCVALLVFLAWVGVLYWLASH